MSKCFYFWNVFMKASDILGAAEVSFNFQVWSFCWISNLQKAMRQRQKNPAVPLPNERTTQNPKLPTSDYHKPLTKSDLFSSTKTVFALCLAFRVANALLVQTYFNPDEHWQALEVAHRIAFGYLQFGSFLFCLFVCFRKQWNMVSK